jgi:hypothetical protein
MADKPDKDPPQQSEPPRVLADFGGRRRIFDRRIQARPIDHPERRSGKDRRSGFDRRAALNQTEEFEPEKRKAFIENGFDS